MSKESPLGDDFVKELVDDLESEGHFSAREEADSEPVAWEWRCPNGHKELRHEPPTAGEEALACEPCWLDNETSTTCVQPRPLYTHPARDEPKCHFKAGGVNQCIEPKGHEGPHRASLLIEEGEPKGLREARERITTRIKWWLEYFNDETTDPHPDYIDMPHGFDETAIEADLRSVLAALATSPPSQTPEELRCTMPDCDQDFFHDGPCTSKVLTAEDFIAPPASPPAGEDKP